MGEEREETLHQFLGRKGSFLSLLLNNSVIDGIHNVNIFRLLYSKIRKCNKFDNEKGTFKDFKV